MNISTQSLQSTLAGLLSSGTVRPAADTDSVMGLRPQVVVEPADDEEIAAVLRFADERGLAVLPRGGGTHLQMGGVPKSGDILLSMARLNQILEHTPHDQTVTVQAGLRLADLQASLGRARQWLALDPQVSDGATIGGLIATNVSGPRRLRYGGVRDQLIGIRVALPDGTIARGGGKVVKNVAGYDLAKLYTGALGTLGVVVAASFRLYPLAVASRTIVIEAASPAPLCALVLRILAFTLVPSAIDVLGSSANQSYTLAARFESGVASAVDEQIAAVLDLAGGDLPGGRTLADADEATFWRTSQTLDLPPTPRLSTSATTEFGGASTAGELLGGALPAAPAAGHPYTVCALKASLLPSEIAGWLDDLVAVARPVTTSWAAHAGHGLVVARLTGPDDALVDAISGLREAAQRRRGTLAVTEAPPSLAARVDLWGPVSALDVMRRLKQQFDPHGILNPGRFVGGI